MAESLRDVTLRLLPYWYDSIVPDLRPGASVLVVSHGNTLRALVKHLDAISDEEIMTLNIPNGTPLLYRLGPDMRPVARGGRYLQDDQEAGHGYAGHQDRRPVQVLRQGQRPG